MLLNKFQCSGYAWEASVFQYNASEPQLGPLKFSSSKSHRAVGANPKGQL